MIVTSDIAGAFLSRRVLMRMCVGLNDCFGDFLCTAE